MNKGIGCAKCSYDELDFMDRRRHDTSIGILGGGESNIPPKIKLYLKVVGDTQVGLFPLL